MSYTGGLDLDFVELIITLYSRFKYCEVGIQHIIQHVVQEDLILTGSSLLYWQQKFIQSLYERQ